MIMASVKPFATEAYFASSRWSGDGSLWSSITSPMKPSGAKSWSSSLQNILSAAL